MGGTSTGPCGTPSLYGLTACPASGNLWRHSMNGKDYTTTSRVLHEHLFGRFAHQTITGRTSITEGSWVPSSEKLDVDSHIRQTISLSTHCLITKVKFPGRRDGSACDGDRLVTYLTLPCSLTMCQVSSEYCEIRSRPMQHHALSRDSGVCGLLRNRV